MSWIIYPSMAMWSRCQKLVRSSRPTMVESNMKSDHNLYLWNSPRCAFFFCNFSRSLLALLIFYCTLTSLLSLSQCHQLSALDSAKQLRCGGPAVLSYPSSIVKKCRSSLSSIVLPCPPLSRSAILPYPPLLGIRNPTMSVHMTHEFLCMHVSANGQLAW